MKFIHILLLIVLISSSCQKEPVNSKVTLSVKLVENGSSFNTSNSFSDSQGKKVTIDLLKFYLAELYLTEENGELVNVKDIALIDASSSRDTIILSVPPGRYTEIKFGVGVPDEMNDADPSNYNSVDHPLSITQNTYWGMNTDYRFFMIDGRYDTDSDGTSDGIFSYHTGFSSSFRNYQFQLDKTFENGEDGEINFNLEVTKILEGTGGNLDIVNESNYHGDQSIQYLSDWLSNNVQDALYLKK